MSDTRSTQQDAAWARGRDDVARLLERVVERRPLRFTPGHANSGATLEAVQLDDGTRLVVKHLSAATDLMLRMTHDRGRAATLWTSGVFDRFPAGVDHATVAAAPEGDGWVIVMRDVSAEIRVVDRVLDATERRRVLAAAAALHRTFRGARIDGLCTLEDWIALMTPPVIATVGDEAGDFPGWVLQGWDRLFAEAPTDVADALAAIHARPAALAEELRRTGTTLIHGDLAVGNVGFGADRVVLLDWGLATEGPAALDYTAFMANFRWRSGASPDELLGEVRATLAPEDERTLQLALLATVACYGWLGAGHAANQSDPARPLEQVWHDWWLARAREVLATSWSPM